MLSLPSDEFNRQIKTELNRRLMEYIVPEYDSYKEYARCSTIYRAKIYVSSRTSREVV